MEKRESQHILVVDDEPLLVRLNKRQLENKGYEVEVVTESTEALHLISNAPDRFDLMISDLTMPNMSGRELIRQVLQIVPSLPIIVFTGLKDEGVDEELNRLGVRHVVEKPVVHNELLDAVQQVLGSK